ncbi:MAG TPA: hypothetical protein DEB12_07815 [Porphyromonadaceae bacterium]|jgi:hypothetical protein|nr:hypothetical protein [Porphyromonadaceae bacterium]
MATTQEVIKELKKHLKEKRLLVIIGAGFSKNASNKYLSWRELLRDMIIEMYGNTKTKLKTLPIDQLVESIISEKGYLSVASDYVRRRGYHEAIDEYVESRTPIIKRDGNDYSMILDGKKQHKPVDLNIHKLLLSFEWNNVYTFNYDNLLDIAADTDKNDDINKEIIKCQEDIIKLTKEKLKKEEGIAKLNNKRPDVQNITASILASDTLPGNNRIKNSSSENEYFANKKLVKDKDEVDKLQKEVDEFKTEIKRNETRIEGLRREQKDLYMIVEKNYQDSIRS